MLNRILLARAILREQIKTVNRDWEDDGEDSGGVWLEEEENKGGILLSFEHIVRCGL